MKINESYNLLTNIVSVELGTEVDYTLKFELANNNFSNQTIEQLKIFSIEGNDYIIHETYFDSDYLYAEMNRGGQFGVMDTNDELIDNQIIPENINILFCYPNPFNPNVTIEYYLDESSDVSIDIYNLMGQKIINLENEWKETGKHSINWLVTENSANEIPSGIYIVKMRYNDSIINRKVTLLK